MIFYRVSSSNLCIIFYYLLGKSPKLDLIFVVGANDKTVFKNEIDFIVKSFDNYKISDDDMLPGVVTYGAKSIVNIGDVNNKKSAIERFSKLRFQDSGADLEIALRKVQNEMIIYARENVPKSVVIFVDNKDQINDELTKRIKALEDKKFNVLLVGIGPALKENDIKGIVTDPDNVKYISQPTDLKDKVDSITSSLVKGIHSCLSVYFFIFLFFVSCYCYCCLLLLSVF